MATLMLVTDVFRLYRCWRRFMLVTTLVTDLRFCWPINNYLHWKSHQHLITFTIIRSPIYRFPQNHGACFRPDFENIPEQHLSISIDPQSVFSHIHGRFLGQNYRFKTWRKHFKTTELFYLQTAILWATRILVEFILSVR